MNPNVARLVALIEAQWPERTTALHLRRVEGLYRWFEVGFQRHVEPGERPGSFPVSMDLEGGDAPDRDPIEMLRAFYEVARRKGIPCRGVEEVMEAYFPPEKPDYVAMMIEKTGLPSPEIVASA